MVCSRYLRALPAGVVTLLVSGVCVAETVSLRADPWCPYTCEADAEKPGFSVEIAREAFAMAGLTVDYQVLSWARSVEDARQGRISGVIGAIPADAPGFVFPSEGIGSSSEAYAVPKGTTFEFEDYGSLDGKLLATVNSYAFGGLIGKYLEDHGDDRTRIQFTSGDDALEKNIKKLLSGRVDLVLDDMNVLRHAIAESSLGDDLDIVSPGTPGLVYIAFSPADERSETYASILSENIGRLRETGRLAAILARYGVTDWR